MNISSSKSLINNFELDALFVIQLYKECWKIEFFQMIKNTSLNKKLLWHKLQCCKLSNMDFCLRILAYSCRKEKTEFGTNVLHFVTDFQSHSFFKISINKLFKTIITN